MKILQIRQIFTLLQNFENLVKFDKIVQTSTQITNNKKHQKQQQKHQKKQKTTNNAI